MIIFMGKLVGQSYVIDFICGVAKGGGFDETF